jgi:UDPglucose 6-dehydrogenase
MSKPNQAKIGFVGLGKLGSPCAEVMASLYDVAGYDIVPTAPRNVLVAPDLAHCVAGRDLIFVAVPTPHDSLYDGSLPSAHLPPKDFEYRPVCEVLEALNDHLGPNQLVALLSTVLPGTVRSHFLPHVRNYRFIYNPYFIAMGTVAWDMVNPEMVLLGTEDGRMTSDAQRMIDFYRPLMKNDPRYIVGTWDEAECIKVFYNTFISAKLSLVNMIQDVAELNGNVNVDVVADALAGSSMRITGPQYMRAGLGDGGPCHPRDNIALRFLSERLGLEYDLFGEIMRSREFQAKRMAELLVLHSRRLGLPIVILGKSYKPGVPYTDGSYSLLVGHYCEEMQCRPFYVDPLTGDVLEPEFGDPPAGVFLLAHSPLVIPHSSGGARDLQPYCQIGPGSVVVDPWRKCGPIPGVEVIHYGDTRARAASARPGCSSSMQAGTVQD